MSDSTRNEIERLNVPVADLTRCLQSALRTVAVERTIAKNSTAQADLYRQQNEYMAHMLRLNTTESDNIEAENTQQRELKEKCPDLHRQAHVTVDNPDGLSVHSNAVLTENLALEKRTERLGTYTQVGYVTQNHVRTFEEYSRYNDLVGEKSFVKTTMMKESTKMRAVLQIAGELNLLPCDFRLWEMQKTDYGTYIIADDVVPQELKMVTHATRFYVEPVQCENDPAERAGFVERYTELLGEEQGFLERVREDLRSCAELYFGDDEDPAEGCGIGSCNAPFAELARLRPEKCARYKKEILDMGKAMLELLLVQCPAERHHEKLAFVKLYDPYDMLPELSLPVEDTLESTSDSSDGEGAEREASTDAQSVNAEGSAITDRGGAGIGATGRSSNKRRRTAKRVVVREYMPVKFAMSMQLKLSCRLADLGPAVLKVLNELHPTIGADWQDKMQRFQ
jgi:hypothetical protein